ncbi:MAG: PilX N-terminal domain-containing pilus assembly protein [Gammaproteobacteria bacterium]|nr:PilX N-terminal domain-containing pilus assembly protein [Gammaproteobacteria bacterium]
MNHRNRQSGAALFMALIFLIIITLISLSAMRSSIIELRMANNDEMNAQAAQKAQAIIDATIANTSNTPVIGGVGETTCLVNSAEACTRYSIILEDQATTFQNDIDEGFVEVVVERVSPLTKPAPRIQGYSLPNYSVATFEVRGTFDASDVGEGNADIVEGVLVLIAN